MVKLAGGSGSDNGNTVVGKLEKHIGGGFKLERDFITEQERQEKGNSEKASKLGAFWDELRERKSWKKVYGEGLY